MQIEMYVTKFWEQDAKTQLSCFETRLYFYLLNVAHKTGTTKPFDHADAITVLNMGTSLNTMKDARKRLVECKLISFESGGSKQFHKTRYHLVTPSLTPFVTPSLTPLKEKKQKKSTPELLYWKPFVAQFDSWYKEKIGSAYSYMAKDWANLKKIYQFLEKRADDKKFEFNEENLIKAFQFFLNKAWDKDDWLKQNFTISNILSQFNQIANGTGKAKQQTGANVSTGSILSRINAMPGKT